MKTSLIYLSILLIFILNACQNETEKARLNVRLMDGPGDYEAVYIDVKEVRVHTSANAGDNDGGWITLEGINIGVFDLLELTNGLDTLLASAELPAGKISQIRLLLGTNNSIIIDGQVINLDTPSAQQSGLKLKVNMTLQAGITYNVLLDFDAARSILKAGNSGKYNLKPVIKAITEPTNGAIKGRINPLSCNPAIYAIQGTDTLKTTYPNEEGYFLLRSLEEGSYKIVFDPAEGCELKTVSPILVSLGNVTNMGTVQINQ